MSTRVRKLLAFVFLIAIPHAGSIADPIPASTHTRVYQENQAAEADLNDSYDVFYDQLSSDGHWIFVENYGYVFQPNVAEKNADWRPYTIGHWESTDRGWYWDTDESFGWATYHYGRWANIDGTGWVWTPGTDWSPAWVSWRVCDTGFVGWAPLPPECPRPSEAVAIGDWCDSYSDTGPGAFCFLPFNAWFNPSYAGSFAPVTQNLELLNNSRNVTNISASKTLISSFGPRVEFIAQQTGRQVNTYTLHYSEVRGRNNFSRSINGNLLNVNGPVAKLKANATKVPTVIKTIVRPTVNKGWNGFTKDEIAGLHRKYASEAHIPSHLPTKPIERVNLVPSATPTPVQLIHNQKEKAKPGKETGKAAAEKGSKGKAGAADHKTTGKHKTASKEESNSKGEGKSKGSKGAGGSKGNSASKSKSGSGESKSKDDDDDESKTAKKSSTSKSSSSKSGSKKDSSSEDSGGSKRGGGSKGSGSKGSGSSKGEGSKNSSKSSSEEKKDE